MSPRTVVEMAEFFRGFYGVIDGIITQAGGSWSVSSNDGGQHVAAPAGGAATVIIRVAGADRGFGLILAENLASVRGMRSLSYRIDDLRDEKQNDSFLVELRRRLACAGIARTLPGESDFKFNSLKTFARVRRKHRNETWDPAAY